MFQVDSTTTPSLAKNTISDLRTRISYVAIIGLLSITLMAGTYYAVISTGNLPSIKLILVIAVVSSILFGCALLGLKFTHQYQAIGHFTQFWLFILLFSLLTFVGGGISHSSLYPFVFLSISIAFCSLGRTMGLLWSALYVFGFYFIAILEHTGFEFPYLIRTPHFYASTLIIWTLNLVLISLLLGVYEWMLVTLNNEHGGNYSRLYQKYDSKSFNTTIIDNAVFNNYLQHAISRNDNYKDLLGIHCIDLRINVDTLQEELILNAYQRASRLSRKTDTLIRVNKSCLIIIIENLNSPAGHELISKDLHKHIMQPYFIDGFKVPFTPSISSVLYPNDTLALESLLNKINTKKKAA